MTDPVRVAVDLTPLLGPPSGIHNVTRGLIDALADRDDIEVSGWLLTGRGARPETQIAVRRSRIPARLAHLGWTHSRFPPASWVTGATDVVHGTNFVAPPTERSVISIQDLSPFHHPQWCRREVVAMTRPLMAAIDRGATVHTSSHAVATEARELLTIADDQIVTVHHGVRPVPDADPADGVRLVGAERYVLVLGTVEHRKNVALAVAALAQLPDEVKVVIAGPSGNGDPSLSALISEAETDSRLVRLPTVDEPTRAALLRGATVLAMPSRYEGFALPPLEALSVGTPVVSTAVGALPELIGDAVDLVASTDEEGFVAALSAAVAAPPEVPTELVDRVAAMTWKRAASQMCDVYQRIRG